jgi:uncharacterized protein with von Willebrand factor type A (vWA) domain
VHWPASLKAAAATGGELASLKWRRRKRLPMPWLALVDVSGSMERYVRLLLAFLHQATSPGAIRSCAAMSTAWEPACRS